MKYGWIYVNLLDLWSEPVFNSERLSQLFFGEPVKISRQKNNFFKVAKFDGYTGWADSRFIKLIDKTTLESWHKKKKVVVVSRQVKLMNHPDGKPHDLHFLFYGTKLYVKAHTENLSKIILPDKDTLYIKSHNIKPIKGNRIIKINGKDIIKESKRFLGIPYLWGGVTAAGFDCSGFVQIILGRFNVIVPRDTKDQIEVGQIISRNEIKTGDLLFFKRHVGFAIGKDRIIHSSVGGNGVRINSLKAGKPDYREDLDKDFKQARRLSCLS